MAYKMNKSDSRKEFSQFLPQRFFIFIRGWVMLILGSGLSIFSLLVPNVQIMSANTGWLPIASFLIILIGLLECIDTYLSKQTDRFIINLQFATIDIVFGAVFLFTLGYGSYGEISLLIVVFLLIKGIFRVFVASIGGFPHRKTTFIGGMIITVLGILIWSMWPSALPVGFISFCLCFEITLRGLALIRFASWLKEIEN
jgi:hypothetical protein